MAAAAGAGEGGEVDDALFMNSSNIEIKKVSISNVHRRLRDRVLGKKLSLELIYADILHDFKGGRGNEDIKDELKKIFNRRELKSDTDLKNEYEKFINYMLSTTQIKRKQSNDGEFEVTGRRIWTQPSNENYYMKAIFGDNPSGDLIDSVRSVASISGLGTLEKIPILSEENEEDILKRMESPGRYEIKYKDTDSYDIIRGPTNSNTRELPGERKAVLPALFANRRNPFIKDNGFNAKEIKKNTMLNPFDTAPLASDKITRLTDNGKKHIIEGIKHFFGITLTNITQDSKTVYILSKNDSEFRFIKDRYSVGNVKKMIISNNGIDEERFFTNDDGNNIASMMYQKSNKSRPNNNYRIIILLLLKSFGDFILSGIIPTENGMHILNTDIQSTDKLLVYRILTYQLFINTLYHKFIIQPSTEDHLRLIRIYKPSTNIKLSLISELKRIITGINIMKTIVQANKDTITNEDGETIEKYITNLLFEQHYQEYIRVDKYDDSILALGPSRAEPPGGENGTFNDYHLWHKIITKHISALSLRFKSILKLIEIVDEESYINTLLSICYEDLEKIDKDDISNINKFKKRLNYLTKYFSDNFFSDSYTFITGKTLSIPTVAQIRNVEAAAAAGAGAGAGADYDEKYSENIIPLEDVITEESDKLMNNIDLRQFSNLLEKRRQASNSTRRISMRVIDQQLNNYVKEIEKKLNSQITHAKSVLESYDNIDLNIVRRNRELYRSRIAPMQSSRRGPGGRMRRSRNPRFNVSDLTDDPRRRRGRIMKPPQQGGERNYYVRNHLDEIIPIERLNNYFYILYSNYYKRIHKKYKKSLKNAIDVQTRKLNKFVIQTLPKYKINKDDVISILSKYNENSKQEASNSTTNDRNEIPLKLSENSRINDLLGKTIDRYKLYYDLGQKNIFRTVINQLNQLS